MNKALVSKTAVRKAILSQPLPFLTLWADADFSGTRLRFRGNLGVRSLVRFNFNDVLSSFEFIGPRTSTLVLFENINYQGNRRIFRGSIDVANLGNFNFNDVTSSFVMSRRRLSTSEINRIQNTGVAPQNFAEVLNLGGMKAKRKMSGKK